MRGSHGRREPAHARHDDGAPDPSLRRLTRPLGSPEPATATEPGEPAFARGPLRTDARTDAGPRTGAEPGPATDPGSWPDDGDDGEGDPEDAPPGADRPTRAPTGRALLRGVPHRDRTLVMGGAHLRLLVVGCTAEDTTGVDVASGALLRLRIPWPPDHEPDLSPFDVVEATLADDPERDDLAQPEAASASSLPRLVGTLRGRRARRMLARLAVPPDGPLLGFPGPSAPYWEFRGFRPSTALVHPARGPQLIRRRADGSTWVRFGWDRDDVWLPVEDRRTVRALDASRRERLSGKALGTALGFTPHYVLAAVSSPRGGHCYKVCTAILPRG